MNSKRNPFLRPPRQQVTVAECTDAAYCNGNGVALLPSHENFPDNHPTACFCMCLRGFSGKQCQTKGDIVESTVAASAAAARASAAAVATALSAAILL